MTKRRYYLAVDFDETLRMRKGAFGCAEHWPDNDVIELVQVLKSRGWIIILWTCRPMSAEIKQWCSDHSVPVDYYNENPHAINWFRETYGFGNWSQKVFADIYLDDSAFSPHSVFSRLPEASGSVKRSPDEVADLLEQFVSTRLANMEKDSADT